MPGSFDQFWMRRAKTLTQALIISGTINIGLVGTFVYFVLKERHAALSVEPQRLSTDPSAHVSNEMIVRSYCALSFQELLVQLENTDFIEEGYTKRDLALACMVAFHHFNIDKALGGMIPQKRSVFFRSIDASESLGMTVFPALTEDHFYAIAAYATTEKWPFTSKGLFFEIKRAGIQSDPSLLEAFYTTPEYHSVYTFLHKTSLPSDPTVIISLMIEGDWEAFHDFCDQQRLLQGFSVDKRRAFLMSYLERFRSKTAAALLTYQDLEFVSRKLDDSSLVFFLGLIAEQKTALENMAKEILISPRADGIRKKVAGILYDLAQEPVPAAYDHMTAVKRFCPDMLSQSITQGPIAVTAEKQPIVQPPVVLIKAVGLNRIHVIEQGDSLWKIARKYKITIQEIKTLNQLETEKLRVGKQLKIPQSSS